jgi:hypothetical protein
LRGHEEWDCLKTAQWIVIDKEHKRQRDRHRRANRTKNEWLKEALRKARGRGLEFELAPEDFWSLPSHCPVFPTIELNYSSAARTAATASLERIDNEKGYVRDNVIIVSWKANDLKKNATTRELQALGSFYAQGHTANTILHFAASHPAKICSVKNINGFSVELRYRR